MAAQSAMERTAAITAEMTTRHYAAAETMASSAAMRAAAAMPAALRNCRLQSSANKSEQWLLGLKLVAVEVHPASGSMTSHC